MSQNEESNITLSDTNDLVSIIVTTKNEEKNINSCLKSICLQNYPYIEIIVVDNNSTDQTKKISYKYTTKVYNKGPERSAQRNYGIIEKSNGKYVMFIDADMILDKNLIRQAVNFIKTEKKTVALHISEIILGKFFFSKVRRFERQFYDSTVIDGARFFKKDEFIKVNGFDETISGPEDWDIDKKIKQIGNISLLPQGDNNLFWEMSDFVLQRGVSSNKYGAVIYHNESEFDIKQYLTKKSYYAKSLMIYADKWNNDSDIRKQLGLYYRYFGVFVEQGKWKRLVMHPLLAFGMFFLRFLVGIKFLMAKLYKD